MKLARRSILKGLLAAPVIIRTPGLLMPIKPLGKYYYWEVSTGSDTPWWGNPGGDGSWYKSVMVQLELTDARLITIGSWGLLPPESIETLAKTDVYPDLIHAITET